jgi:sugar phosphate isomerase/epimerase
MNSLSRRKFVTLAGTAGAAAVAASVLPRNAFAGPIGVPYGIQLYTVGKPLQEDPAGTLKQLYTIGYREVETAGTGKTSAADFRKLLDEAGLKCPSAHLQLMGEDLGPQFADANALGAHFAVSSVLRSFGPGAVKSMTAPPAGAPPRPLGLPLLGEDGFKQVAAHMNEVGKKAHAAGLQYAYHNHNFEFEKMPDGSPGYDILIKETDPELVKFEIDCGWMVVAGFNPVDYFHKYPGRFRMLHIKDFKPVTAPTTSLMGPDRPQGSDLGKGFIDYKPIFAAAKSAGIEHVFAEQEAPFTVSQMESAKLDFDFLQKFS